MKLNKFDSNLKSQNNMKFDYTSPTVNPRKVDSLGNQGRSLSLQKLPSIVRRLHLGQRDDDILKTKRKSEN